jgi:hypothetical protein
MLDRAVVAVGDKQEIIDIHNWLWEISKHRLLQQAANFFRIN